MAVPAYSTLFYEGANYGGPTIVYTVPAGYLIVVRDILINGQLAPVGTSGQYADVRIAGLNIPLFSARYPDFFSGVTYAWEGRQVLNAGESLSVFTSDGSPGAKFRISGYLLTL